MMQRMARKRSPGQPIIRPCDGRVATYGFSYQAMTQLLRWRARSRPGRSGRTRSLRDGRLDDQRRLGCGRRLLPARRRARMGDPDGGRAGAACADAPAFEALMAAAADLSARADHAPALRDAAARSFTHPTTADGSPAIGRFAVYPACRLEGLMPDTPALFVGRLVRYPSEGTLSMHRAFTAPRDA